MSYLTHCPNCQHSLVSDTAVDDRPSITTIADIVKRAAPYSRKKKEFLLAFLLDARDRIIRKEVISIGTLTASLAHPREIFQPAVEHAAAGLILVHNHPSGDPSPSEEDIRLTRRVSEAGRIMGIELLDHLIVGKNGAFSFKASGRL